MVDVKVSFRSKREMIISEGRGAEGVLSMVRLGLL